MPGPKDGLTAERDQIALEDNESTVSSEQTTGIVTLQHCPTTDDLQETEGKMTALEPGHVAATLDQSNHADQDHEQLWRAKREDVSELRDMLVELFKGLERLLRWHYLMRDLADKFEAIHGELVDCSGLLEVTPAEEDEEVPKPISDPAALQEIRDSFLNMAPHVIPYMEREPRSEYEDRDQSWNLPLEARQDPCSFWAKIWDSFDFSSPQYFDTTLRLEEQPEDAAIYLTAWDRFGVKGIHLNERLCQPTKPDPDAAYLRGRDFFVGQLDTGHGIKIRPRKIDSAVPFPWLDCELSRFTGLGWELVHDYDYLAKQTVWKVDYNDEEDPCDPLHRTFRDDHFSPFRWLNMLVTNVRIPLPRQVLNDPPMLIEAMKHLYGESHPLQMLAEARMFARSLSRRSANEDARLRAAMLYQVISRLAKEIPSFFEVILDGGRLRPVVQLQAGTA